jgi:hypothetical protein
MARRVVPFARGIRICTLKPERSARSTRITYETTEFEARVAGPGQKTTAATVQAWTNLTPKRMERQSVFIIFNAVVELDEGRESSLLVIRPPILSVRQRVLVEEAMDRAVGPRRAPVLRGAVAVLL